MKRIATSSIFLLLLLGYFLTSISNCSKEEEPTPDVIVADTNYVTVEGITFQNGNVTDLGITSVTIKSDFKGFVAETFTVEDHGHVASRTNTLPTWENKEGFSSLGSQSNAGGFTSIINDLQPAERYYARAYFKKKDNNTGNTSYEYHSRSISFTTKPAEEPGIQLLQVDNISDSSFTVSGKISDFRELAVTSHGFVWSETVSLPTLASGDGSIDLGEQGITSSHSFSAKIEGLKANTTYYVRAFGQNEFKTGYSENAQEVTTFPFPTPKIEIDTAYLFSDENNTLQPNPDEVVTFNVQLKNLGNAPAEGVEVIFNSPDLTVLDNLPVQFGNILVGSPKIKQVRFKTSAGLVSGDIVEVYVLIEAGENNQWPDGFSFEISPPPVPEIAFGDIQLLDDANNTGEPNPDEALTFSVQLVNSGDASAENVEVEFSSPDLTVISALPVQFGDILPNSTVEKQVEMRTSPNLVSGDIVQVNTQVSSNNGDYREDLEGFSFEVFPPPAPVIVVGNIQLSSDANNTGEPNPGEAVVFNLTLENTGELTAQDVALTLHSEKITVLDAQPILFGDIVPGGSSSRDIEIELDEGLVWEEVFTIRIEIVSGDESWEDDNTFSVEVFSPYVVTDGLAFYLNFDEDNQSSVTDLSGNLSGFIFGAEYSDDIIPGSTGFSMDFKANEQDYIVFPLNPVLNFSNATFSFWLKTNVAEFDLFQASTDNNNGLILGVEDNFFYLTYPANDFNFNINEWPNTNSWRHFVIVTNDNGKSKLFINGVLVSQRDNLYWSDSYVSQDGFFFGRNYFSYGSASAYYNGKVDNFRIYNRPLSASEVEQIHQAKQ